MARLANTELERFGENRFVLEIKGVLIGAFSECAGLSVEREIHEYAEGGVNDFVHRLPGRTKYTNLTLKRGITNHDHLMQWFFRTQTDPQPAEVTVQIFDTVGKPLRTWAFAGGYPVKWTGPSLNAGSDSVATEQLEIAHQGMINLGGG